MTIVFKLSDNLKEKVIDYYQDKRCEKTPPYAIFQAKEEDTTITLYESGKIMFQGVSADVDADIWASLEKRINKRNVIEADKCKNIESNDKLNMSTIGSDEVGTGDFFGPIVVTATYVNTADFAFLESLGVKDSKKLDDAKILKIAPQIMKKIPYATYILNNKEYNEYHNKDFNMNKMKAILHNKVLYKLKAKNYSYAKIVVDDFCGEKNFYKYLEDVPEKVKFITFMTKAEDKVLSVACASIISRYFFIQKMNDLSDEVHRPLPKGAGENVTKVAKELKEEYGIEKLFTIAKMNFKNANELIEKEENN